MDHAVVDNTFFRPSTRERSAARHAAEEFHSAEALRVGQVIGPFTLRRFIARGGMGQVWEAFDASLRRVVALKLMLPERVDARALERFAREARAGGRLAHPNVVTTLSHGTDAGWSWIAQELVKGSCTLKDSLDDLWAADVVPRGYYAHVARLVAQLADALHTAHGAGVIHRDLKPQNVLIAPDDTPKLTDFGLARVSDDSFLSITGEFAGTYAYMSPEQVAAGRIGLDHRTDIFSLGVVLYELLTLRRPFDGDTTHQIAEQILYHDPPSPTLIRSQCPRELSIICGMAIEKSAGARYQTMAELAADLRRHLSNEPILARPPGPITRGIKWARRNPALSSSAVIGLLALAVVSGLLARNVRISRALADTVGELERSNQGLGEQTRLAGRRAEEIAEQARIARAAQLDAERRTADVLSLSAQKDLDDLTAAARELWPAHPEMIPRYEQWLADARLLLEGRLADPRRGLKARPSLVEHREKLRVLEAGALPGNGGEGLAFEDPEDGWWHRQLTALVSGIEALHDSETGIAGDTVGEPFGWGVARRLDFARGIAERSVSGEAARELWASTRAAIAASPRSGGLELEPQLGLLPLGPDPVSGLFEFAHLQTGDVPARGEDGRLILSEEVGLVLVLIGGGTFWMGAQATDPDGRNYDPHADPNESPVHEVELSPYFISKYEMTQGQWQRLTGSNPSMYRPRPGSGPSLLHPVEQVSWVACRELLGRLDLDLPSEAQWEHAARGGTSSVWWTGDDRESLRGRVNLADRTAYDAGARWTALDDWPDLEDGWVVHAPVGTFPANGFGLHEVAGNVWEWCLDGYRDTSLASVYAQGPRKDPVADPAGAALCVFRGGSFASPAFHLRSALRSNDSPHNGNNAVGLRPARRVEP